MFAAITIDGRALVVDDKFVASRINGKWVHGNRFTPVAWRRDFHDANDAETKLLIREARQALIDSSTH